MILDGALQTKELAVQDDQHWISAVIITLYIYSHGPNRHHNWKAWNVCRDGYIIHCLTSCSVSKAMQGVVNSGGHDSEDGVLVLRGRTHFLASYRIPDTQARLISFYRRARGKTRPAEVVTSTFNNTNYVMHFKYIEPRPKVCTVESPVLLPSGIRIKSDNRCYNLLANQGR